ncbi:unnamed protein product [Lepeophtheirus salmonis]|uniref:(salmon louse) hypothetical protein n=1 Tax=Lepeophtheirus salmonis TaxID=72036 RepID=A0A7R8H556_LEPSM|nr:unnamed protein product [Lepeophtheirus salmonis]CAF2861798.1 unnamed protein product [Lepeophtheirus salmonis]
MNVTSSELLGVLPMAIKNPPIIRAFPNINCKISMDGYSNLAHNAAYHGNLEILKYLIRIGATINENGTVNNNVNGTASEIALEMNHLECYSVLQMESAKLQLLDKLKLKLLQLCKAENLRIEDLPRLKLTIQSYRTFASMIEFGKRNKHRRIAQLYMIGNGIEEMFEFDEDYF